jgi:two-component system response regulator MprA
MGKTRGRILCVDDDGDTCDMMIALLGLEGYEVVGAQSVSEGLSFALAGDFDLVLLDWVFKDGTGIELCMKIRNTDASTPILFYSGMALSADIDNAMRAGAQGFLIKPVNFDELLQSVSTFVRA